MRTAAIRPGNSARNQVYATPPATSVRWSSLISLKLRFRIWNQPFAGISVGLSASPPGTSRADRRDLSDVDMVGTFRSDVGAEGRRKRATPPYIVNQPIRPYPIRETSISGRHAGRTGPPVTCRGLGLQPEQLDERSRISTLRILPVTVIGNSSTIMT